MAKDVSRRVLIERIEALDDYQRHAAARMMVLQKTTRHTDAAGGGAGAEDRHVIPMSCFPDARLGPGDADPGPVVASPFGPALQVRHFAAGGG